MPPLALIAVLLLVALPLLEIAILIKAGSVIGVWGVMAIIVATAVIGVNVVRHQGLGVARRAMEAMRSGQPPVEPMLDGMLLMLAGGCLIAPGLITDVIGLILLIPAVRLWAARLILRRGFGPVVRVRRFHRRGSPPSGDQPRASGSSPTIEGDYERLDERPVDRDPAAPGRKPVS